MGGILNVHYFSNPLITKMSNRWRTVNGFKRNHIDNIQQIADTVQKGL